MPLAEYSGSGIFFARLPRRLYLRLVNIDSDKQLFVSFCAEKFVMTVAVITFSAGVADDGIGDGISADPILIFYHKRGAVIADFRIVFAVKLKGGQHQPDHSFACGSTCKPFLSRRYEHRTAAHYAVFLNMSRNIFPLFLIKTFANFFFSIIFKLNKRDEQHIVCA